MTQLFLRFITALVLCSIVALVYVFAPTWVLSSLLIASLGEILLFEWPAFHMLFLTPLYPVLPFLALIALNEIDARLLLFLFVVVCTHDSCAYLIGRRWGHHRLMPRVSPKKSWEGFIGGTVLSLIIALILRVVLFQNFPLIVYIPFVFMLNICALGGDLFESYLKRRVYLKDSGSLLPGHGGLLDRFDSMLPNAIILYLAWLFFPKLFL